MLLNRCTRFWVDGYSTGLRVYLNADKKRCLFVALFVWILGQYDIWRISTYGTVVAQDMLHNYAMDILRKGGCCYSAGYPKGQGD